MTIWESELPHSAQVPQLMGYLWFHPLIAVAPSLHAVPPREPKAFTPVCTPVLLGATPASAFLSFGHLFPSCAVCFGTTVSPQATLRGHMENETSELICVKNNQEKNQSILPCGGEAVVWAPWAGRQRGWSWQCCKQMACGIPPSAGGLY